MDDGRAWELDQSDPVAYVREQFHLPQDAIYLDGNSLGLASKTAERVFLEAFDEWKTYAIDGWSHGQRPWLYNAEALGARLAPFVGARPAEVVATGSISVNIHQLLSSFYRPTPARSIILADTLNFPTDLYALQSQLRLHDLDVAGHLLCTASRDGHLIDEDDIIANMSDQVAVLWLPTVLYRSGQLLDVARLTDEAHRRGILVGLDLAHSVGCMPHRLHDWGVDFAVWCNYKYMNGGPGAVGGLFVHEGHFGGMPGLAGWFGSDKGKQFAMDDHLTPAGDAGAYQIGTPHLFSSAPLFGSLEIMEAVGIEQIRAKSLRLTDYLMRQIDLVLAPFDFTVVTPREHHRRGGHVSVQHNDAARIVKAMKVAGIVPDYREPNIIRLAPIALYTSYQDVEDAIQRIRRIMMDRSYDAFENERDIVA
ncbi:kynureninase [Bradyrhizobium jicamae]|uniref:Kynureninase n=1 Tax=Bradyrhizobium jicamae TaxID=280332 RepID=A0ABS5FG22_9BRAD|nr:kynureninase [Bradyrhizobium jicamae]MBR0795742.1 kynureninase [Bradyrhizobium jicamae]